MAVDKDEGGADTESPQVDTGSPVEVVINIQIFARGIQRNHRQRIQSVLHRRKRRLRKIRLCDIDQRRHHIHGAVNERAGDGHLFQLIVSGHRPRGRQVADRLRRRLRRGRPAGGAFATCVCLNVTE